MKKERQTLLQARRMTLDHYNLGLTILLVVLVLLAAAAAVGALLAVREIRGLYTKDVRKRMMT